MVIRRPVTAYPSWLPCASSSLLIALFGLMLTAFAWIYVTRSQTVERAAVIERIHRDNDAMARAFEEHVRRVLKAADGILLFLQHEYEEHGQFSMVMKEFIERSGRDPILNQIAVVDAGGNVMMSAVPHAEPVNLSQQEIFQVHARSASAGLYIGKPVRTRAAETWSFFLTRRLNGADGTFAGIVTLGLNPAYFSSYYDQLELGPDRAVLLVGRDGIVRARRFQKESEIGQDLSGTAMFARIATEPAGHHEVVGRIDRLRRFASYRALPDYPLVVAVSELTSSALAPFERLQARWRLTALLFSLFVAAFCSVLIAADRRDRRRREQLSAELAERRRAEAALRESGERYRDLFENANDAIFLLDEQHRYVDANRRALEIFGFTREELLGRRVFDFIPPEQLERSEAAFRELVEHGQYHEFVGRMKTRDGRWIDIEVNSSAIVRDGTFVGSRDIVRDITERKRAAEEGSRLLKAVSIATEGIAMTDGQDRFVYVNEAHARIYGYRPEEMVGKTWRDTVPQELVPLFEGELVKTLHNREVGIWMGECPSVRKDGAAVPTEITATSRWDEAGAYLGHICIVRDITERKRTEEQIRQSERFIRNILDTVDEGFIVVDRDYRILTVNQAYCGQTALTCDEVIGKKCFEVSHHATRPCYELGEECAVKRVFETGKPHNAVHKHPGPDGHLLFVETKAFPIKDDAGRTVSVIETLNNITERYLLEEERLKTQKLESIGTLAGGIAHDFNNLLQGIFGYITMAKLCLDEKERSLGMIEQAERALHQSVSLTTQLLTFSKGGRPVKEPVALEPVIESAVKFALSGSRSEYRLIYEPGLWQVQADAGQLGQVIQNIAMNADQAMPLGGCVEIVARNVPAADPDLPPGLARRNHVMISIRDNGTGIAERDLERIFDPYFTTKERGTGLGLATSYSIIRNHEGRIVVKSALGEGTTFRLYLPAAEAVAEAPKDEVAVAPPRGARILFMDDEEMVREVAGELLKAFGHAVVFADRGEEAILAYIAALDEGNPFDLAILDLTIRGGMGGVETAGKLREIDPEVKAVASSGYSDDDALPGYRQQGFAAYLKKPYDIGKLQEMLNSLLA